MARFGKFVSFENERRRVEAAKVRPRDESLFVEPKAEQKKKVVIGDLLAVFKGKK